MLCDIRDALQYMRFGASEEELIELSEVLKAELIVVEILSFSDNVVDFAAKGKQKKRKCTKGYNCGGSCITRKKNCRKALKGEAKNAAEWLRMQLHGKGGTGASGEGKAKKANEAKAKKDNSSKGLMKSGEDFLENSERKAIDDYFEAQKTLDSRKNKINNVREQLYREYGAELVKSGGGETEGVKKTREKLDAKTKELDRLDDDLTSKRKKAEEAMENARQRVIKNRGISEKELNDYVNSLNIDKKVLNDNPKIREQIKEYVAMTGFKSKRMKGLDITSDRAHAEAHKNSGIVNTGRSQTEKAKKETLFHEMSHFYEAEKPEMRKAANEWRDRKAKDYSGGDLKKEKLSDLTGNKNYKDEEVAYRDSYVSPYVGKTYEGNLESGLAALKGKESHPAYNNTVKRLEESSQYTEVVSMGVERFANRESMLDLYEKDKKHFDLILGMLSR